MNLHEIEERDYHPASELENAYAWSGMNRKPDDAGKINAAVAAGKFVVVEEGPEYCPSTDALLGSRKFLVSVHDSRADAEAALAAAESYCDEVGLYVLPRRPWPIVAVNHAPLTDADLPF